MTSAGKKGCGGKTKGGKSQGGQVGKMRMARVETLDPTLQFATAEKEFTETMQAFQEMICDLSTPEQQVAVTFSNVMGLRKHLLSLHSQFELSEDTNDVTIGNARAMELETKKCDLAACIVQVLSAAGGAMALDQLASTQAIREAKKGVVAKINNFLQSYPDTFHVSNLEGADGKTLVSLVSESPIGVGGASQPASKKRKRAANGQESYAAQLSNDDKEALKAALVQQIAELVETSEEGYVTVQFLGGHAQVKEIRKGIPSVKLQAFVRGFPDVFALEEVAVPGSKDAEVRISLVHAV